MNKMIHRFIQRLDLRSLNKHVALQNFIYYMWKNIRKQYNNNKLKNNSSNME